MNSMTQIHRNINFAALLSFEQIQQYETDEVGMMRGLTLASLTKSFDELLEPTIHSEEGVEVFYNYLIVLLIVLNTLKICCNWQNKLKHD
ncbi:hypothetical protein ACG9YX_12585 [Acinetobacter nematophilus]|uniref:hypothetical protein n=1 Tax=Acinetobacter nematophilus TaxID=2994642 RepID=UPI003AF6263A